MRRPVNNESYRHTPVHSMLIQTDIQDRQADIHVPLWRRIYHTYVLFRIKVAISAKLGGFKKPKNSAEERITGDNETTRLVLFKIDSTPPWHCRQASNCKEPAISLKSDAVKVLIILSTLINRL